MSALTFEQAREVVFDKIRDLRLSPATESVSLKKAAGRILGEDIQADRDYPPFARAARDGFAVRSADIASPPATLSVIGETRAGEPSRFSVGAGQAVEIMTGAPGPEGADCIVMVEYSRRDGDKVVLEQSLEAGKNFVAQGSEASRREPGPRRAAFAARLPADRTARRRRPVDR